MKRLLFWLRWSGRDLRERWILVVAIATTIGLGTGAYVALDSISTWRNDSNSQSLALLKAHDVRVYLAEGSFATPDQLRSLVAAIPHAGSVTATEARLTLPARIDASTADRTILVPGRLVGMSTGDATVDSLQIRSGRGLEPGDAGRAVAILDDHFANYYGLLPNSTIRVGDTALEVVGRAFSPDYLMIIGEGGDIMAEANYAVAFLPLDAAGAMAGHPGLVNELVLRLSDPSLAPTVRDELTAAGSNLLPDLGVAAITGSDEDARRLVVEDAETDGTFFAVIAAIVLAAATFAAFNLTTRIVESQRRQIGIGMALGLPARTLAIRPLAIAAEIALLGVFMGMLFGVLLSIPFKDLLESMIPMPVFDATFRPEHFIRPAIIGFVLPFAASIYPVLRAVRAKPVDAIRTGYLAARRPGLAALAGRAPLPPLIRLPLRNVLRTPRRTLLTALGITAAVAVLIATTGMLDTLALGMDRAEAETVGGSPDRLSVTLETVSPQAQVRAVLAQVPGVARADLSLVTRGSAVPKSGGAAINLILEARDLRDNAWKATLATGRLPQGPGEILLSSSAASTLGLELGDTFTLNHLKRISDTAVAMVGTDITLVGTHPSPMRPYAYMDIGGASLLGMEGLANRATVLPVAGTDADALRRTLFDLPGVVSVQPIGALVTSMRDFVEELQGIMGLVAVIALLMSILVAYNSATISQDERTRELATMLAFGLPVRRVVTSVMLESGFIGVIGTILGLGGGMVVLNWLVTVQLPETMPDLVLDPGVTASTLALAVGLGIVAVALTPILLIRRLVCMDLPAKLRVVE